MVKLGLTSLPTETLLPVGPPAITSPLSSFGVTMVTPPRMIQSPAAARVFWPTSSAPAATATANTREAEFFIALSPVPAISAANAALHKMLIPGRNRRLMQINNNQDCGNIPPPAIGGGSPYMRLHALFTAALPAPGQNLSAISAGMVGREYCTIETAQL